MRPHKSSHRPLMMESETLGTLSTHNLLALIYLMTLCQLEA
jgi:hypothetical protein